MIVAQRVGGEKAKRGKRGGMASKVQSLLGMSPVPTRSSGGLAAGGKYYIIVCAHGAAVCNMIHRIRNRQRGLRGHVTGAVVVGGTEYMIERKFFTKH